MPPMQIPAAFLRSIGGTADGFIFGSTTGGNQQRVDSTLIASTGTWTNFATLAVAQSRGYGVANSTVGVFRNGLGTNGWVSLVFATKAMTTFGSSTASNYTNVAATNGSSTKGFMAGGEAGGTVLSTMSMITIGTTGTTTTVASLSTARSNITSSGNQTRGLWCGGQAATTATSQTDGIDYTDYSSGGGATFFAFLSVARYGVRGSVASPTRAFVCGGFNGTAAIATIDTNLFSSFANFTNMGNLTQATSLSCSGNNKLFGIIALSTVVESINLTTQVAGTNYGNLLATGMNQGGMMTSSHSGI